VADGLGDKEDQVGQQVQRLRIELGLSQHQLAERMKPISPQYAKWRQSTIYKIEHGDKPLRVNELFDLAAALGVGPEVLLAFNVDSDVLDAQIAEMEDGLRADEEKLAGLQEHAAQMEQLRSHSQLGVSEQAEIVARRRGALGIMRRLRANMSTEGDG
jgi:transcriptional regulator with XRE-family HTH domain